MPDHLSSATDDDRVISLRTRRKFQPAGGHQGPPLAALDTYQRSSEPDDFRHRMLVNALAFSFVAALVLAGLWLADTITEVRKTQDCVLSGKRGCVPVEAPPPAR